MTEPTMLHDHASAVASLSGKVKDFYQKGVQFRIYHGRTNSTRAQKFEPAKTLDVSHLNRVISVNTQEGYVLVEPNVSMEALVEATLAHALIPPVVMEFKNITVGGGIQGGACESSSFKHGLFHDICEEYEVIVGNGEVVRASRSENSDLYWGTACSYGSLGVITLVKLRLIPAKPYVRLTYTSTASHQETIETTIREVAKKEVNFVDGIIFDKNKGSL